MYMCHNLAKLDTDIKVTLVDKAGKVDQGTVVQKDATMDNLINLLHPSLHKMYMCHNLAKLDTDIKVTLADKAGKVDQGTVVQTDATMDNLINLLPLPGGVTGPHHQAIGRGLPTSPPLKAS